MRKWANVGAYGHRHAGGELLSKFADMKIEQFLLMWRAVRSQRVSDEVLRDSERGHGENMLLSHQPHRLVAELIRVLNGLNPSPGGVESARLARGMNCNILANASRLTDSRGEFAFAVLIWSRELAIADCVWSGLINLREVRALFVLLAHHLNELLRVVRVIRIRQNTLRWVVADGILVPAESVDRIPADSQPWPRDFTSIDSIANCRISRTSAHGPQITLGGEACHQVIAGAKRRQDRSLRYRFLNGL